MFRSKYHKSILIAALISGFQSNSVLSFELLSEGAMGTVSAISANSAEEIINAAAPTAAGLRIDDGYEVLPFKASVEVSEAEKDEISADIDFSLVKEVDAWAGSLQERVGVVTSTDLEIGYADELPPSDFDESSFVIREEGFDKLVFAPEIDGDSQQSTTYEIGRVEQTLTKLEQKVDSVQYIVRRNVDFVATIDAFISDDQPSIGSGYISNLSSISNVKIATVRD